MSKNFVVYQSRNRLTGTLCRTLNTKHAASTIAFKPKTRYVAECVEHKTRVSFSEHYAAGRAIAHVNEWCKKCQAMIKDGRKVVNKSAMKTGPETAANGRPDLRMASENNAHDKNWRNRNKESETQRVNDQPLIYDAAKRANDVRNTKAKRARRASKVTTKVAS